MKETHRDAVTVPDLRRGALRSYREVRRRDGGASRRRCGTAERRGHIVRHTQRRRHLYDAAYASRRVLYDPLCMRELRMGTQRLPRQRRESPTMPIGSHMGAMGSEIVPESHGTHVAADRLQMSQGWAPSALAPDRYLPSLPPAPLLIPSRPPDQRTEYAGILRGCLEAHEAEIRSDLGGGFPTLWAFLSHDMQWVARLEESSLNLPHAHLSRYVRDVNTLCETNPRMKWMNIAEFVGGGGSKQARVSRSARTNKPRENEESKDKQSEVGSVSNYKAIAELWHYMSVYRSGIRLSRDTNATFYNEVKQAKENTCTSGVVIRTAQTVEIYEAPNTSTCAYKELSANQRGQTKQASKQGNVRCSRY
ncbi:hypothetical protein EDD18DRAFT_1425941 [Armillaria luteobubalina]|uniref:Uncharacterized protein n=1 Tax=Armillaria luteobubalina TaxID=153913 RepID=A0AA39PLU6_9AGAR|nr:hypothetical protein EDD18DRAFT_1425941 [Armillaria luteobubalina]